MRYYAELFSRRGRCVLGYTYFQTLGPSVRCLGSVASQHSATTLSQCGGELRCKKTDRMFFGTNRPQTHEVLDLHPTVSQALCRLSCKTLSERQVQFVRYILKGKDTVVCAPTGSGKTLVYLLPLIDTIYKLHDLVENCAKQKYGKSKRSADWDSFPNINLSNVSIPVKLVLQLNEHAAPRVNIQPLYQKGPDVTDEQGVNYRSIHDEALTLPGTLDKRLSATTARTFSGVENSFLSMMNNPLGSFRPWVIIVPNRDLASQICSMIYSLDPSRRISIQLLSSVSEFPIAQDVDKQNSTEAHLGYNNLDEESLYPRDNSHKIIVEDRIRWGAVDVVVCTPYSFVEDMRAFGKKKFYPGCVVLDEVDELFHKATTRPLLLDIIQYLRPRYPKMSRKFSRTNIGSTPPSTESQEVPISPPEQADEHSRGVNFAANPYSPSEEQLTELLSIYPKDIKKAGSGSLAPTQFIFVGATMPKLGPSSVGCMIPERFCTALEITSADVDTIPAGTIHTWVSTERARRSSSWQEAVEIGDDYGISKDDEGAKNSFGANAIVEKLSEKMDEERSNKGDRRRSELDKDYDKRLNLLVSELKKDVERTSTIVFVDSTVDCINVYNYLEGFDWPVVAYHSEMPMSKRMKALSLLVGGYANVMVATDLASRGLDIKNVNRVINFHFPTSATSYIHRCGRINRLGDSPYRSPDATDTSHDTDDRSFAKIETFLNTDRHSALLGRKKGGRPCVHRNTGMGEGGKFASNSMTPERQSQTDIGYEVINFISPKTDIGLPDMIRELLRTSQPLTTAFSRKKRLSNKAKKSPASADSATNFGEGLSDVSSENIIANDSSGVNEFKVDARYPGVGIQSGIKKRLVASERDSSQYNSRTRQTGQTSQENENQNEITAITQARESKILQRRTSYISNDIDSDSDDEDISCEASPYETKSEKGKGKLMDPTKCMYPNSYNVHVPNSEFEQKSNNPRDHWQNLNIKRRMAARVDDPQKELFEFESNF